MHKQRCDEVVHHWNTWCTSSKEYLAGLHSLTKACYHHRWDRNACNLKPEYLFSIKQVEHLSNRAWKVKKLIQILHDSQNVKILGLLGEIYVVSCYDSWVPVKSWKIISFGLPPTPRGSPSCPRASNWAGESAHLVQIIRGWSFESGGLEDLGRHMLRVLRKPNDATFCATRPHVVSKFAGRVLRWH